MSKTPSRPRVAIIGTGGTISMEGRHSLDTYEYMEFGTRHDIDSIVARFPEIAEAADVYPKSFRLLPSSAISAADWLDLVRLIHVLAASEEKFDGIVVTHGTATLEETAYFLNLALKVSIPVVVVGAQKPLNALGSDAGPNLLSAVRLAGSREACGLGVLVLLNDEIQAAREVTKTSTHRLQTFRSRDMGILGYTDPDGQVALYRKPARCHAPDTEFDVSGLETLPRVDIALAYAGADGSAIKAFSAAGARGIVLSSVAPGIVTPDQQEAIEEARQDGIAIVMSCRAGSGRILRRVSMDKHGIVAADNLSPQKARVLAMLSLTVTDRPDRLQEIFDRY